MCPTCPYLNFNFPSLLGCHYLPQVWDQVLVKAHMGFGVKKRGNQALKLEKKMVDMGFGQLKMKEEDDGFDDKKGLNNFFLYLCRCFNLIGFKF